MGKIGLKTYVENCNVALRTNEVKHNLENRIRTSNMLKGLSQCSRMNLNYQVYFPDVVSNNKNYMNTDQNTVQ